MGLFGKTAASTVTIVSDHGAYALEWGGLKWPVVNFTYNRNTSLYIYGTGTFASMALTDSDEIRQGVIQACEGEVVALRGRNDLINTTMSRDAVQIAIRKFLAGLSYKKPPVRKCDTRGMEIEIQPGAFDLDLILSHRTLGLDSCQLSVQQGAPGWYMIECRYGYHCDHLEELQLLALDAWKQ